MYLKSLRHPFALWPLAAVLLLCGCSVGPDYQKPETPLPPAWAAKSGVAEAWPSLTWWQDFSSPALNVLMDEASQANNDLAAAMARVRQADAQVKIAGANLSPSLQVVGGEMRNRNNTTTPKSGGSPRGVETLNGYFSASYELDFWGKYADAADAAVAAARASHFDWQTAALTIQSNVANTFFTVASLNDRLVVARNNLEIALNVLDAVKARAEAGTTSALDVAQQESVVAGQRAALPPLTQQLRQNVNALAILVGRLPEAMTVPPEGLSSVVLPRVVGGLPAGLLIRRPDVQSAESQLEAANANIKAAEASVLPDLKLTAQGGLQSSALGRALDPASVLYSLAASATQPIFSGGALEGGIEYQQARFDELLQTYRKTVLSAFGDVENALVAVDMTSEQENAQRIAVATAQRAYDIAQAQMYSGTIDIVTMLNAQRTLFQAEDTLVQVKLLHAQAVVGLFRALGGGWQAA
ncbi:efflux transporter outer membrane subunit [Telmatospirillum sp.]|uniref:efflux transporter outer membrane subunit n=1 Tax=Telmatospirillum sp. TaxID=2079197 RepID=UPI00284C766D|nr:efflux transporter outer membrane subunit [Telmatospirillum sp.]MDR3440904.1 efflux transporter outer membrane subunit [Telmatospirillum sp.]